MRRKLDSAPRVVQLRHPDGDGGADSFVTTPDTHRFVRTQGDLSRVDKFHMD